MKSSPKLARFLAVPARKPSPKPTSSSSDPTPHAIPNIVRKERSLCVHLARTTSPRLSKNRPIIEVRTLDHQRSYPLENAAMTAVTVLGDAEHVRALPAILSALIDSRPCSLSPGPCFLPQPQRPLILDVIIPHRTQLVPQIQPSRDGCPDCDTDKQKPAVCRQPDGCGCKDCRRNHQRRRASNENGHMPSHEPALKLKARRSCRFAAENYIVGRARP